MDTSLFLTRALTEFNQRFIMCCFESSGIYFIHIQDEY